MQFASKHLELIKIIGFYCGLLDTKMSHLKEYISILIEGYCVLAFQDLVQSKTNSMSQRLQVRAGTPQSLFVDMPSKVIRLSWASVNDRTLPEPCQLVGVALRRPFHGKLLRCHFGNFHLEAPASPVWTSHHIKVRT
jgi:hypothetical protein